MSYYICDFETEQNLDRTYVWAFAILGLWESSDDTVVGTSIDQFIEHIFNPKYNKDVFFFFIT